MGTPTEDPASGWVGDRRAAYVYSERSRLKNEGVTQDDLVGASLPSEDAPKSAGGAKLRPVALVTGASRGIGRAITLELARRGFDVAIHFRSQADAAHDVAKQAAELGADTLLLQGDVSDVEQVRRLFTTFRTRWKHLDVLVNNAGMMHEAMFAMTPVETFWQVMHTNLGGVVHCSKVFLPLLARKRQGHIINVASIAAFKSAEGLSAYAASKAAIVALSKGMAREMSGTGVRVNVVAPGLIDTAMPAQMSESQRNRTLSIQPIARLGRPEEVANLVGYLAADAPAFMTGNVIQLDGGLTL